MSSLLEKYRKEKESKIQPSKPIREERVPSARRGDPSRNLLNEYRKQKETSSDPQLNLAIDEGSKLDPVESGRVLNTARKLGTEDLELVGENLPELESTVTKEEFERRRAELGGARNLDGYMRKNPRNAAIVKENYDDLWWFEKIAYDVGHGASHGWDQGELAGYGEKALLFDNLTQEDEKEIARLQQEMAARPDYGLGFFTKIPGLVAEQLARMARRSPNYAGAFGIGFLTGAGKALLLGQAGPQAATPEEIVTVPAAGFTMGFMALRWGMVADSFRTEGGLAYLEYRNIKDENGNKIDKNLARGSAALVGTFNGIFETIGLSTMARTVPWVKKLTPLGMRKALKDPTTRKILAKYLKDIGISMTGEGFTEGLQELSQITGKVLLEMEAEGLLDDPNTDIWDVLDRVFTDKHKAQIWEASKAGAGVGLGFSSVGGGFTAYSEQKKLRVSNANQQALESMTRALHGSKILKQMPEEGQEIIGNLLEGSGAEKVYVPVENFKKYFQEKGFEPDEVAEELGGAEGRQSYDEAVQTGGNVEIPTLVYSTKIIGSEHDAFFKREVKLKPEDMNLREKEAYVKKLKKKMEKLVADQKDKKAKEKPTDNIEDNFTRQLMKIGFSEADARHQAQVNAEFFRRLGARTNQNAQKLFDKHGIEIHAPDHKKAWENFIKDEGIEEFFDQQVQGKDRLFQDGRFEEGPTSNKAVVDRVHDPFGGNVVEEFDVLENYDYKTGKGHPLIEQYIERISKDKDFSKEDVEWIKNLLLKHDPKAIRGLKDIPKNEKLHEDYEFNFKLEFREDGTYLQWVAEIVDKKTGKRVGSAYGLFGNHNFGDRRRRKPVPGLSVKLVDIDDKHQRKGLGKELYRTMVEKFGRPVIDVGRMRSEEGAAFRDAIRDNKVFYQEAESGQGGEDIQKLRKLIGLVKDEETLNNYLMTLALEELEKMKFLQNDKFIGELEVRSVSVPKEVRKLLSLKNPVIKLTAKIEEGKQRAIYLNKKNAEQDLALHMDNTKVSEWTRLDVSFYPFVGEIDIGKEDSGTVSFGASFDEETNSFEVTGFHETGTLGRMQGAVGEAVTSGQGTEQEFVDADQSVRYSRESIKRLKKELELLNKKLEATKKIPEESLGKENVMGHLIAKTKLQGTSLFPQDYFKVDKHLDSEFDGGGYTEVELQSRDGYMTLETLKHLEKEKNPAERIKKAIDDIKKNQKTSVESIKIRTLLRTKTDDSRYIMTKVDYYRNKDGNFVFESELDSDEIMHDTELESKGSLESDIEKAKRQIKEEEDSLKSAIKGAKSTFKRANMTAKERRAEFKKKIKKLKKDYKFVVDENHQFAERNEDYGDDDGEFIQDKISKKEEIESKLAELREKLKGKEILASAFKGLDDDGVQAYVDYLITSPRKKVDIVPRPLSREIDENPSLGIKREGIAEYEEFIKGLEERKSSLQKLQKVLKNDQDIYDYSAERLRSIFHTFADEELNDTDVPSNSSFEFKGISPKESKDFKNAFLKRESSAAENEAAIVIEVEGRDPVSSYLYNSMEAFRKLGQQLTIAEHGEKSVSVKMVYDGLEVEFKIKRNRKIEGEIAFEVEKAGVNDKSVIQDGLANIESQTKLARETEEKLQRELKEDTKKVEDAYKSNVEEELYDKRKDDFIELMEKAKKEGLTDKKINNYLGKKITAILNNELFKEDTKLEGLLKKYFEEFRGRDQPHSGVLKDSFRVEYFKNEKLINEHSGGIEAISNARNERIKKGKSIQVRVQLNAKGLDFTGVGFIADYKWDDSNKRFVLTDGAFRESEYIKDATGITKRERAKERKKEEKAIKKAEKQVKKFFNIVYKMKMDGKSKVHSSRSLSTLLSKPVAKTGKFIVEVEFQKKQNVEGKLDPISSMYHFSPVGKGFEAYEREKRLPDPSEIKDEVKEAKDDISEATSDLKNVKEEIEEREEQEREERASGELSDGVLVTVYEKESDEKVGHARFIYEGDMLMPFDSDGSVGPEVRHDYQRMGLGGAMYWLASEETGMSIDNRGSQTASGGALRRFLRTLNIPGKKKQFYQTAEGGSEFVGKDFKIYDSPDEILQKTGSDPEGDFLKATSFGKAGILAYRLGKIGVPVKISHAVTTSSAYVYVDLGNNRVSVFRFSDHKGKTRTPWIQKKKDLNSIVKMAKFIKDAQSNPESSFDISKYWKENNTTKQFDDLVEMTKLFFRDEEEFTDFGRAFTDQFESVENTRRSVEQTLNDIKGLVTEEDKFRQDKDPKDPRGMISIGANRHMRIDLFQERNLSTFLHESGHMYLEVLGDVAENPDAPAQVKDDYNKILKWLGVSSRAEITRYHHEKWATGFETYLKEGKAPSAELRSAFAKFKAWLIDIYGAVTKLKVKRPDGTFEAVELSDEVREVMDRLFASKEQIQQVKAEESQIPMFEDMKAAGMSDSQATAYAGAIIEAQEAALEEMTQKHLRQLQREKTKFWKDESERVKQEILPDIHGDKIYIALTNMQRGTLPNGEPLPKGMQQIKLSKEALEHDFGPDFLKTLPRPYMYAREGGIHHDMAADLFGFKSGKEMLDAIKNAKPMKQLIKERVEMVMKKHHGDMMIDEQAARTEALNSIHNDKLSLLMRSELNYLASNHFAKFKGLAKKIAKPVPPMKLVKETAKAIIAGKKIRDIKPGAFSMAMAKAAREAQEKFFAGDFIGAFDAKKRQLLNNELYREATRAIERVNKTVDFMKKFQRKTIRQRLARAGGTYLEQIDRILDRYSFKKGVSLKALDKQQSLLAFMKEQQAEGQQIEIPERLLIEAQKKHYKDTQLSELLEIRDTVTMINHLAKLKNELIAEKEARDLEEAESMLIGSMEAHHSFDTKDEPLDYAPGVWKNIKKKVDGYFSMHTKAEFIFRQLDGFKPNGVAWKLLFKPFVDAENAELEMMNKTNLELRKIFDKYTKGERALFNFTKEHIPEINAYMTKANIMTVALNVGNQYNKEALMRGEGWNEEQVQAILRHMTKRDWDTVQALWDHIETFWPAIEQQEKDLNGLPPPKVEVSEVQTKFGNYRGGYYPVIFDTERSHRQFKLDEAANVQEMFGGQWARAMTQHGFTHARTNTGGKPLLVNMTGLAEHLSKVIHDLTHRKAVINASKIISRPAIREAIEHVAGKQIYRQLNPWLAAIAADRNSDQTRGILDGFFRHIRMGVTYVNMGWKATTAIVQPSGFTQTVDEIGTEYALLGVAECRGIKKIQEAWKFASSRSTFIRERPRTHDRDIKAAVSSLGVSGVSPGVKGVYDVYTADHAFNFFAHIGLMDMAVSLPSWMGAYRKAMDGKVENIEMGDEIAAIDYADHVVRVTQGGGAIKDLAMIQRGGEMEKTFTMFYSFFSVQFNRYQEATKRYVSDGDMKQLASTALWAWFIPAVLDDIILGRGPREDEDWWRWFIRKQLMFPTQGMILIRDGVNSAFGEYGSDMSPLQSSWNAGTGTIRTMEKLALGEKEEITRRDIKQAVLAGAVLLHLPGRQVWNTLEYFYLWLITEEQQPESPMEGAWRALVIGKDYEQE